MRREIPHDSQGTGIQGSENRALEKEWKIEGKKRHKNWKDMYMAHTYLQNASFPLQISISAEEN